MSSVATCGTGDLVQVALSLGSNIERDKHIRLALSRLEMTFGELVVSPIYETTAVGFEGAAFYNLVVVLNTGLSLDDVIAENHAIEAASGRVRGVKSNDSRTLDIDVLLYGDADLRASGRNIPRDEILHAAYVLKPLADVLPDGRCAILAQTFAEAWQSRKTELDGEMLRVVELPSHPEQAAC